MTDLECLSYAVGHANEGVCILLKIGSYQILLDCGLRDVLSCFGKASDEAVHDALCAEERLSSDDLNSDELRDKPGKRLVKVLDEGHASHHRPPADAVFCSHAHADHARGLLALHRLYPDLPIYSSHVTAQLMPLNWRNETVPDFCQPLDWRSPTEIFPNLTVQIWPAGHLPGAAAVLFSYHHDEHPYTVFYTGDFLLANSRLVEGLPLEEVRGLQPDVLIVEGSYGTTRQTKRRQQENQLAEKINQAIAQGKSVLLPTPTLGVGQELLMLLRSHHHFTGRWLDILVTPSIAAGCDAYLELLPYFPSTVQNFARYQPLFWDDRVRPRVKRLVDEKGQEGRSLKTQLQEQSESSSPLVILTDVETDLGQFCELENREWVLLLPRKFGQTSSVERGVCDQIQFSAILQEYIRSGRLTIDSYLLSEHCDGPGTVQLIHNIRPQHVVFVHGSPNHLTNLTSLEELQNRYHLHLPDADVRLELPVGETFIQPSPPEQRYEAELTELKTAILITLPKSLSDDNRWQHLSDTGLIEARWQDNELVLRGLQPQELLDQDSRTATDEVRVCCDNCAYYRGQRCGNAKSSLFGLKVTPEGSCPAFEFVYQENDELD
ncbi:MAG: MBL fold metallo-hydrolase [Leptolyngbyaceae bacterium]|nr:MBL fold metallo-hydrolase [Leptolyngbyaceae bacterium]